MEAHITVAELIHRLNTMPRNALVRVKGVDCACAAISHTLEGDAVLGYVYEHPGGNVDHHAAPDGTSKVAVFLT